MRPHIWERMLRFWEADRGLSIILALLVIIVFVLPVLLTPDSTGRLASDIAFSALLVAGAVTATESLRLRFALAALVMATLLVRWASAVSPSGALAIGREASTLAMLLLFAMVVAARSYRPGPVTHHRIQGAIAVLLLLGLVWANAYELLHLIHPDAFSGAVGNAPGALTWIYYSFVTLTTMGYGDITPVHPIARSLAISEAVSGQLYIAVTLARLMALHVAAGDRNY
jgi:Ion channel